MVEAAAWVRWLDLEQGLASTLREGNLIAAAVMARSLAEEAIRGIAVRKAVRMLHEGGGSSVNKQEVIKRVGSTFTKWCFPSIEGRTQDHVKARTKLPKRNQENGAIEDARKKLNDYVHPNYGSHNVVHDPANSYVFEALATALCEIYKLFTSDCWLNESRAVRSSKLVSINQVLTWEVVCDRVRELTVHPIQEVNHAGLVEGAEALVAPARHQISLEQMQEVGFDFTAASSLLSLLGLSLESVATSAKMEGSYPFYDLENLARWCTAKATIASLGDDLKEGPPSTLRLVKAIEAFSALTNFKKFLMARSVAVLFARKLPISAVVLTRAMIEFHAVAKWLKQTLEDLSVQTPDSDGKQYLGNLERALCSSLIGSYNTGEQDSELRRYWAPIYGTDPLNLTEVMMSAVPGVRFEYDLLSHIVHGVQRTGMDLWGHGGEHVAQGTLQRALSVIGMTTTIDAIVAEAPLKTLLNLKNIDRLVEGGRSFPEAVQATRLPEQLVFGDDIRGEGTEWDPFEFREGLIFQEALNQCANQLGYPANYLTQLHRRADGVDLRRVSDGSSGGGV